MNWLLLLGGTGLLWMGLKNNMTIISSTARDIAESLTKTVVGYIKGVPITMDIEEIAPGKFLRADAAAAFRQMQIAALAAGVTLNVVSGWRSNDEQNVLYQMYLLGTGNLAAKPGTSNHQSGIALDIAVGTVLGGGTSADSATYRWLAANAGRYGWKRTVSSEPWHWEFI